VTKPTIPPVEELKLAHPDDLTLGELFAIQSATGIDVQSPESTLQQIAALLWFALKPTHQDLSWSDMLSLTPADLGPHWQELTIRSAKRTADAAQAAQEADDAAALVEQDALLGEELVEPTRPAGDPT
jgi:hypothetical protein